MSELEIGSKFKTGPVGITVVEGAKPTYAQWEIALNVLTGIHQSMPFWIGDMLNIGEHTYGQTYSQALEATGLAMETLANYKSVCARVTTSFRNELLSYSHHALVAACEPPVQKKWLDLAAKKKMTVAELREAMQGKDDDLSDEEPVESIFHVVRGMLAKIPKDERHDVICELIDELEKLDRGKA